MEYPISIDSLSVNSIVVFDIFLTISGYSVKKQIALTQEDLDRIPLTLGIGTKTNQLTTTLTSARCSSLN